MRDPWLPEAVPPASGTNWFFWAFLIGIAAAILGVR